MNQKAVLNATSAVGLRRLGGMKSQLKRWAVVPVVGTRHAIIAQARVLDVAVVVLCAALLSVSLCFVCRFHILRCC